MISAYHRPETIEQALALLARRHVKTAALVGFDAILGPDVEEVVDLQALHLNQLSIEAGSAVIGTGLRLQSLLEDTRLPAWLRAIIKAEASSTFRNMYTLYSVIQAASPESSLLAALLVCDAQVAVVSVSGRQSLTLATYLAQPAPGILSAVHLHIDGRGADARLGRTPADSPIVAAVGRRGDDGRLRLALCGIAATPLLVEPEAIADLQPSGDFRGSAEYRREMAAVLSGRVMNALA